MKKTFGFIISTLLGIALFIAVLSYTGLDGIKTAFQSFSWPVILVAVALGLLQLAIQMYRWKLILDAQGDRVPYRKLIGPKFVGFTVSYLTPGLYVGGEPVRAYTLKRDTGVRMSHGMASIIVDKILDFTYPLPFLIAALLYSMFTYDLPWGAVSAFILTLLILIAVLGIFYIQTYRGRGFFSTIIRLFRLHRLSRVERIIEKLLHFEKLIIEFFNHRRALFLKGLGLSLLGGLVIVVQFMVVLHSLGIQANFVEVLIMMVFMILSFLMPIPASLGSFEVGQGLVFVALGYPASIGIAFTLILRVAELFKLGIGLVFISHIGVKYIRRVAMEKNGDQ